MSEKKITIRLETKDDYRAVENLTCESFWNVYRPGCISQTCGHADERRSRADERLGDGSYTAMAMRNGGMVIADGVPEVMRAVRQQLFLGASQIKIMAGGGLSSKFDNFYTTQYTFEELKAAVDCASDYGTYVMTHIYTPECMQRAAKAGVRSFEHATLMDEETAAR